MKHCRLLQISGVAVSGMQARKVSVRQPKKPLGVLVNPADVEIVASKEAADGNLEELKAALRKNQGVNVLQCIINHKSFSQSVENLFALSSCVSTQSVHQVASILSTQLAQREHVQHCCVV